MSILFSRVADYGYTKLKELFEALPHVVQIMGDGSKTVITLAHRAQASHLPMYFVKEKNIWAALVLAWLHAFYVSSWPRKIASIGFEV